MGRRLPKGRQKQEKVANDACPRIPLKTQGESPAGGLGNKALSRERMAHTVCVHFEEECEEVPGRLID